MSFDNAKDVFVKIKYYLSKCRWILPRTGLFGGILVSRKMRIWGIEDEILCESRVFVFQKLIKIKKRISRLLYSSIKSGLGHKISPENPRLKKIFHIQKFFSAFRNDSQRRIPENTHNFHLQSWERHDLAESPTSGLKTLRIKILHA